MIALKILLRNEEFQLAHQLFDRVVRSGRVDDHLMAVLLRKTCELKGLKHGMRLLRYWVDGKPFHVSICWCSACRRLNFLEANPRVIG